MATSTNTKVSPTLHPSFIQSMPEYSPETAGVLITTISAMEKVYESATKVHEVRESLRGNSLITEDAKILKVGELGMNSKAAAIIAIDKAISDVQGAKKSTEKQIDECFVSGRSSHQINREIRAHFKSLGKDARKAFNEALANDDQEAINAVLAAPAYLSGLTPADHSHFKDTYRSMVDPVKYNRLKLYTKAEEKLHIVKRAVPSAFEKAVGPDATVRRVVKLMEQRDKASQQMRGS